MIVKCPECSSEVSSFAINCPCCGYPLKKQSTKNIKRRARLPNGFGQITRIKNRNLKKPFRAMVTTGKDSEGKPIVKLLKPVSYFTTYNEAYKALLAFNDNPFNFSIGMTMEELYKEWSSRHYENINPDSSKKSKAAWNYCHELYDLKVREIRIRDLRDCIEKAYVETGSDRKYPSLITKVNMKNLLNQLFDYAVENELTDKNYARMFGLPEGESKKIEQNRKNHICFDDSEMERLWSKVDAIENVDMILIQCYSGWRPVELCELEISNVDLKKGFMRGGKKTKAGTNRLVPIHPFIRKLVEHRYQIAIEKSSPYLFTNSKGTRYSYKLYLYQFESICRRIGLNLDHKPHDCRVEFVTLAKRYDVDEYAIKYIVGHRIVDLTESVYTRRDPEWLKREMEKIKGFV